MLYAIIFAAIQPGLAAVELASLQGRWVATEFRAVTFDCVVIRKPKQTRLEVTARQYVLRIDGVADEVGELTIHRASDPKGLDLQPPGKRRPRQGIYALDGRTLKVALADRRPGWTSLGDNEGMIVITFRRAEK